MIGLDRHAGACLLVVEIDKILFGVLKLSLLLEPFDSSNAF